MVTYRNREKSSWFALLSVERIDPRERDTQECRREDVSAREDGTRYENVLPGSASDEKRRSVFVHLSIPS